MSTQPDHNPDENGWCQNDGCMWNSWNAKSDPPCPTKLPKRAGTIQEQEELLHGRPPEPTGDAGEQINELLRNFVGELAKLDDLHCFYDEMAAPARAIWALITASNQAAEAKGRRELAQRLASSNNWRVDLEAALGDTNDHQ